ncbi:hypothetical protein M9H77_13911 [Catharanthus roseus]|uniref:Uncharacterized protein n=1 Tax=Catharanthus roseus TaxID=4058 RepID=A0ACC0BLR5_CATRO|nr:hypothetical protein M9H77_13911 [Catharanthus roseus]
MQVYAITPKSVVRLRAPICRATPKAAVHNCLYKNPSTQLPQLYVLIASSSSNKLSSVDKLHQPTGSRTISITRLVIPIPDQTRSVLVLS